MTKKRLDVLLTDKRLVSTRSQAENLIRLGKVKIDGKIAHKPGQLIFSDVVLEVDWREHYVSRAGFKLASVAKVLRLDFKDAVVLDVGSSTGGFTDYALQHGAQKVIAVDVGTDQLHHSLRTDPRIELFEKTDIRHVFSTTPKGTFLLGVENDIRIELEVLPTIIVIDISFMSLRMVLPHIVKHLVKPQTQIVAMVKPQFEAGREQVSKGVIKNDSIRRRILKDFESWARQYFVIKNKKDSHVAGAKGNQERFYLLKILT